MHHLRRSCKRPRNILAGLAKQIYVHSMPRCFCNPPKIIFIQRREYCEKLFTFFTHTTSAYPNIRLHRYLVRTPARPVSIFFVIVLFAFTWAGCGMDGSCAKYSVGILMNCWQASSIRLLLNDDGNNFYYGITVAESTQNKENDGKIITTRRIVVAKDLTNRFFCKFMRKYCLTCNLLEVVE